MITLTPEQRRAVSQDGSPQRVIDPDTQATYVLVPEAVYNRARQLFASDDEQFITELYPSVMETFGREGWDDPAMDIYNDLDPRKSP
jgi:hypothetical protein